MVLTLVIRREGAAPRACSAQQPGLFLFTVGEGSARQAEPHRRDLAVPSSQRMRFYRCWQIKTFVGFVSTLIVSEGLGLLVDFTFGSGRSLAPARHVKAKRVTQAADENGEGSITKLARSPYNPVEPTTD